MKDLELEIIKIGNQIGDAKKIQEVGGLFFEMINKCQNAKESELTKKVKKEATNSLIFTIDKFREFYGE
jgi:hypothetical protein